LSSLPKPSADSACAVSDQGCELVMQLSNQRKVILEDIDLTP